MQELMIHADVKIFNRLVDKSGYGNLWSTAPCYNAQCSKKYQQHMLQKPSVWTAAMLQMWGTYSNQVKLWNDLCTDNQCSAFATSGPGPFNLSPLHGEISFSVDIYIYTPIWVDMTINICTHTYTCITKNTSYWLTIFIPGETPKCFITLPRKF